MHNDFRIGRRRFLKSSAGFAAGSFLLPFALSSSVSGKSGFVLPSERITIGCIGLGGQGTRNMKGFLANKDVQVVAVCDVETGSREYAAYLKGRYLGREPARRLAERHYGQEKRAGVYSGCAAYKDFRKLLDRDDIDVVVVCTPDHWHVPISIAAAKAGKDIYCEKPLTLTIAEGRALSNVVNRYGRVFQTGTQHRSEGIVRRACELVRNRRIGKLKRISVEIPHNNIENPVDWQVMNVPSGFDYDMWLGPAPVAAYTRLRCHYAFRFILDYSGGQITNFGAHFLDIAQWANDCQYSGPVEVEGTGEFPDDGLFNTATKVHLRYGYSNGVELVCDTGGAKVRFVGSEGWLEIDWKGGARLKAFPESIMKEKIGPNEVHLYASSDHKRDFLDAVKSRGNTIADVETGHRSSTVCHLGNIAMRVGGKLKWCPESEKFLDGTAGNELLSRSMRAPWHL